MNCACAVGRARATSCGMPLAAPINGSVACVNASISAMINAICPISGSIGSIVISASNNDDVIRFHLVDDSMFVINSTRPPTGQFPFEWFWLPDS